MDATLDKDRSENRKADVWRKSDQVNGCPSQRGNNVIAAGTPDL
jgi:hypothetical protein